jgi:hypothetical protein
MSELACSKCHEVYGQSGPCCSYGGETYCVDCCPGDFHGVGDFDEENPHV